MEVPPAQPKDCMDVVAFHDVSCKTIVARRILFDKGI